MRIFDNSAPVTRSKVASKRPKNARQEKIQRNKKKPKARVELTPDQIREKFRAHKMKKTSTVDDKLKNTKETSSFMSSEIAEKVTLNSINKHSQKFTNVPKVEVAEEVLEAEGTEAGEIEAEEGEVLAEEGEKEVKKGALMNDPNSYGTIKKLKDAMNSGLFKVDAKTRKVLGDIMTARKPD